MILLSNLYFKISCIQLTKLLHKSKLTFMKKITILILILLNTFSLFSQSPCDSAIQLTPGTQQCGDTATFGDLFDDSSCLGYYGDGDDALFVYTAAEDGETLDILVSGVSIYAGVAVSLGCPTGGAEVCLESFTNGFSGGDLNVTTNGLASGQTYFVHISTWPFPQTTTFCLDTTVIPAPACPAPTALALSSITTTTANLSWTAGAAETTWEYQVVPAGTTAAESGIVTYDNPLALAGLSSNTSYDLYLRAVCNTVAVSEWTSTSFTTLCAEFETFPFAETFDSDSSTSNCWTVINVNEDGDFWNTSYTYNTYSGDGVAVMLTDYNDGDNDDWLISPALVLTGNERLKFQQRVQSPGEPNDFEVLLSTTDNQPSSFTNVLLANAEYSNAPDYQEFIIDMSSFVGVSYIAFHVAPGGLDGWRLYIDEVIVEEIPSTTPGCASNFTNTADENCGNYDFSVSWDSVSGADGYLLTAGTTSGGNDLVDALDLGSSTTYNFSSVIIGQNYFYTVTPYNVNGNADGCVEQIVRTAQEGCYCVSLPTSNDGTGISSVSLAGTDFTSGGDITYEDFTATSVSVGQSTTASLEITFATGYTYNTHVWVDFNDDFNFDESELLFSGESTSANPTTLDASFSIPSTAALGEHRLRIGSADSGQSNPNACYNGTYGVTIDMTIDVTDPPACIAPSALAASNVTASTADISWSAGGTETAYEYVYQASGTGEPTGAGTQLTTTSVSLSGLSSNTDYEIYVRSACDDGSFSTWSSLNFTTSPACGDTVYDSGGASGNYASNELVTVTVYPDVTGDLVTFTFLSFDTESCCDDLTVYDGPSTSSPLIGTYAGSTLPDPITSSDSTGALTFVFDSDGSLQYGGYEILISCGPPPACPSPSALAASNVTASTADISWSAGGTETAYEYVYQASGTGEPTGAGTQLTTTSVSLSGLSSNTDYEIYVRSACDDGSFSTWSSLNFTTSPACGDTVYDSGGASGNYASNELVTVTVYPDVTGDLVTFTFLSFDTESCCDDLTVYDGPSTSSPLIGTYAGSTLPDPITSSDSTGALTFVFDSDGSLQYGGYEILISCGPLGIDDYAVIDFTYNPNPVNDQLAIKAQRKVDNITIFNMLGQVVLRQLPNSLECVVNMAEMQAGAYFVRVSMADTIETVRVIKK